MTQQWFIWRPALYLYLSIFLGLVFAARKRSWKLLLFLTPILVHSVTLLLIVSSQESRYQYPVFLISFFCLALVFIPKGSQPWLNDPAGSQVVQQDLGETLI
jgi:hypothetical protein